MYKTIVLHLSSASGMPTTFDVAAHLAIQMDAHLVGAAASGMVELNYLLAAEAPMAMMPAINIAQLRDDAQFQLRAFEKRCKELAVSSFESRLFDTSAANALLLQSRFCDLLVVSQQEVSDFGMLMPPLLPGNLVTQAARPVLLVPARARSDAQFDNVLVAWNGSLGASRALAFAMPIVQRARKVLIAVCNAEAEKIDVGSEPGADLAAYLARHHSHVEVLQVETQGEVDTALCLLAHQRQVDLIVAGSYGHSRLHDWVLGSTTQGLIEQTPVPLLMTH
jgi:nucleotide-binding universal stress UspA family protein